MLYGVCRLSSGGKRREVESLNELWFPCETSDGLCIIDPFSRALVLFEPGRVERSHVEFIDVVSRGDTLDGRDETSNWSAYTGCG